MIVLRLHAPRQLVRLRVLSSANGIERPPAAATPVTSVLVGPPGLPGDSVPFDIENLPPAP